MMTNLREAIESVGLHIASGQRLRDFQPELRLLLAAARVVSCAECKGTGQVDRPIIRWAYSEGGPEKIPCEVCLSARKEIAIYG